MVQWHVMGAGPAPESTTAESVAVDVASIRGSLREEARDRTRARIVGGAMAALARDGLDATVEDIADECGVSRRTIFRHFSTHGELLGAAVREVMRVLALQVPQPPPPGSDVRTWLSETSVTIHRLLRDYVGRAFWDIHVVRAGRPRDVTEALEGIAEFRLGIAQDLATSAWRALESPGTPPDWVITAFELELSGFATNFHAGTSCEVAGAHSARVLWAALVDARRDQDGVPANK
jgi:AcrR family transcriptional regulator